ncbi:MAG: hypothetical protein QG656_38 [Candidatus Hydrogenedentes bacterium]|nr:hypothetical protein [Candidatus Hydrogenedentota bacterium]
MDVDPGSRRPAAGKTVIGWIEQVDLTDWGIRDLRAKVDTGARTSALHVENLVSGEDGSVQFQVVVNRNRFEEQRVNVCAQAVRWARVRSSSGEFTQRCFVRTRMRLGGVVREIEISLVSREKMAYRMLLGRQALARHFLVDVSKRHALGRKPTADKKELDGENRNPEQTGSVV